MWTRHQRSASSGGQELASSQLSRFQYTDEPTYGRPDGENYNMGLVDIEDRPYEELVSAAASLDTNAIHGETRKAAESSERLEVSQIDSESSLWDRRATALDETAGTGQPFADLYAAWDRNFLYLILYAFEYADEHLYSEGSMNLSDAVRWDIHGGANPITVRIGSTKKPSVEGASASAEMRQKSTRFMVVLKIPATYFGKQSLAAGDSMPLDVDLSSFGRLYRMHWKRTIYLESSRAKSL